MTYVKVMSGALAVLAVVIAGELVLRATRPEASPRGVDGGPVVAGWRVDKGDGGLGRPVVDAARMSLFGNYAGDRPPAPPPTAEEVAGTGLAKMVRQAAIDPYVDPDVAHLRHVGGGSVHYWAGRLVVVDSPEVQERVGRLLQELRAGRRGPGRPLERVP